MTRIRKARDAVAFAIYSALTVRGSSKTCVCVGERFRYRRRVPDTDQGGQKVGRQVGRYGWEKLGPGVIWRMHPAFIPRVQALCQRAGSMVVGGCFGTAAIGGR